MQKIKKAIVAVAGSGTRLLPVTKAMPKEMLPIVDKPIIQLVVEELVAAGIEDIILVTKWDKKPLEDHFDHSIALEIDLEKAGKLKILEEIKKIAGLANFIYVRQAPQYGNGVPILSASTLVKDEFFVFCFGDDLVKSKVSFTKQMVDEYEKVGKPMIGVQEMPKDVLDRYGIVDLFPNSMRLKGIVEKPEYGTAPSNLASFGRMILNQEIVDELKNTPLGKGGELWIVDAIEKYIKKGGDFYAKKVEDGEWLTTGDPLNYLRATLKYAFDRPELRDEIADFYKNNY
ncbi:MAG: Nucleotidyl transferase [Candidatus Falkowbacteria bacterium GW2011_GWC2_38_22]|uniref:UTP--glucose-1-phosphate uridylyltransferase n=1 Tax=Candidatus Falkowbacteria bacterium GW2011_GWE1_38_31 TaxID=1618638 RepID=A0A0G0JU30_9BACT|nr:MAG: Nucleotidyl transferase [Candidatus Falkowbacteria bacterium GW2011_GWF2_38_1205]KKQ62163.1 MAG: Nucleotidyl transferase [Candidatus Falkowbacteria bacterium GW2011_GWC2_38_22]KKQ64313.1 MAG: Nucleotidyl transferase [Candidatus Falkowbacteria bacterium GW2011_GWF1_38_22]KKQ66290.1 MAG: Nucleotidyl transferase [Candidatus Falkowbacteria bacterium GW2011_GWE2_38_254]KKQ71018.1 MAG: Nucleotidyl transferase [Candidatus Falkowbacteria bacterium GW2011_GWE1_38_31]KKQ73527.1 MAG: Nucleotidyl 